MADERPSGAEKPLPAHQWAPVARTAIERDGYWYQPDFADPACGLEATRRFAEALGEVMDDVIVTCPSADASPQKPFDQRVVLGWHGDFCTHARRASLSMSYIERSDPRGSPWGDWRVANVTRAVATMMQTERGRRAVGEFSERDAPFAFDEEVSFFRVLEWWGTTPALRFYGAGLREGVARTRADDAALLDAVDALEEAAEACAIHLVARAGSLLVVDNWHALHYRCEQTVEVEQPRRAILMFVR